MVSLWPWKANDATSSFEKTLSAISAKITKANVTRESLRSWSRRLKVLWTIYTSLTYIFCTLILVLVTGWANWGIAEYSAVVGSPFLIYGVRAALAAYYNFRLSKIQAYLDELNKQRDNEIEKFKTATKYNSTQQLLEKYGAAPQSSNSSRASPSTSAKAQPSSNNSTPRFRPNRTNLPPPPTANIRRPEEAIQAPETPSQSGLENSPSIRQGPYRAAQQDPPLTEEFAPNAFIAPPQYSTPAYGSSHRHNWYDRILDVILGEDEGRPINRLALICSQCRLVNGQAPPGVKTLEEVGKWRCSSCGAVNGEDTPARKIIEAVGRGSESPIPESSISGLDEQLQHEHKQRKPEMAQKSKIDDGFDGVEDVDSDMIDDAPSVVSEREGTAELDEDNDDSESVLDTPPARSTRSQSKRSKRT